MGGTMLIGYDVECPGPEAVTVSRRSWKFRMSCREYYEACRRTRLGQEALAIA